jgi:hypothetical protein
MDRISQNYAVVVFNSTSVPYFYFSIWYCVGPNLHRRTKVLIFALLQGKQKSVPQLTQMCRILHVVKHFTHQYFRTVLEKLSRSFCFQYKNITFAQLIKLLDYNFLCGNCMFVMHRENRNHKTFPNTPLSSQMHLWAVCIPTDRGNVHHWNVPDWDVDIKL